MVGSLSEVQEAGREGGLELTAETGSLAIEQDVVLDLAPQEEEASHASVTASHGEAR